MARTQRPQAAAREISRRLLATLQDDLGLSMTEAASALGYSTASTLHAVKNGRTLPDAARLAKFAHDHGAVSGRTLNLHWLLTGDGDQFFLTAPPSLGDRNRLNVDIINTTMRLSDSAKEALLVLLTQRS